ncbi:type II toxin-antitoxin system RelE/ParE family toxin [Stenotrophomonas maltophilia]|uniref:type II toxin-antitoxin system RelE/ParE family toxin n=1 Tax=Stenotrophomonas maltophilia TaxID=40324 RepID=UPI0023AB32EC|nr:type II toxin-antitoxin system RelE/ParE family toxin [Stenotrophomonas maltophilia]
MHVIILAPGPWKILAELEEREGKRCSLVDDLSDLGANYARTRAALVAKIKMVAREGPQKMPWVEVASSTDPKVYKFVAGDLRLYFCYADGAVLVCSSCAVKKTQKTERLRVEEAVKLLKRYKDAVARGAIKEYPEHDRIQNF